MVVILMRAHHRSLKFEDELRDVKQRFILAEEGIRVKNKLVKSLTEQLQEIKNTMAERHEARAELLATTLLEDPWANVTVFDTFTAGNIMDTTTRMSLDRDTKVLKTAFEAWKFGTLGFDEQALEDAVLQAPVTASPLIGPLEQDTQPMEMMGVKKHHIKQTTWAETAKSTVLAHAAKVTHRDHPARAAVQDNITKFMKEVDANPKKALQGLFKKLSVDNLKAIHEELGQKSATLQKKIDAIAELAWGDDTPRLVELSDSIQAMAKTTSGALLFAVMSARMDTGNLKTLIEVMLSDEDMDL
jgi:hypothetical protein